MSVSYAYKISSAIIRSPSLTTLSHYYGVYMTSPKPLTHKLRIKYQMNKLLEEDTVKPQLAEVDPHHHAMVLLKMMSKKCRIGRYLVGDTALSS